MIGFLIKIFSVKTIFVPPVSVSEKYPVQKLVNFLFYMLNSYSLYSFFLVIINFVAIPL